jgi:hypothetical protein
MISAVVVEHGLVCPAPEIIYLVHQRISNLQGIGYLEELFETVIQQQELQVEGRIFRLAKTAAKTTGTQKYGKYVFHRGILMLLEITIFPLLSNKFNE